MPPPVPKIVPEIWIHRAKRQAGGCTLARSNGPAGVEVGYSGTAPVLDFRPHVAAFTGINAATFLSRSSLSWGFLIMPEKPYSTAEMSSSTASSTGNGLAGDGETVRQLVRNTFDAEFGEAFWPWGRG